MLRRLNPSGYTFVELAIAMGIMGIMASSVMIARTLMSKQTVDTGDKAYAAEKAIQMFEELKALSGGRETNLTFLDQFSDPVYVSGSGVSYYNPLLTTDSAVSQEGVTNMAKAETDPVSGNKLINGHNRYVRRITVSRMTNDPYARQVDIKVWLYAADSAPLQGGLLLADVGGILRTLSDLYPPSQAIDFYVLAVQTIPAWWAQLADMYATFQGIIGDIQSRTPGLVIRPHYITRSGYGRDQYYAPLINKALPSSASTALNYVYFYPGTSIATSSSSAGVTTAFFDPTGILECGNFLVDGTPDPPNTSQFTGCPAYSVADRNNNALRYPDELNMYAAVTAAAVGKIAGYNPVTEISERMLLEGMMTNPVSFQNAIIVNLHGELLPIPPMRNYSDAARYPDNTAPGYRVVTHPQNLYYPYGGVGTVPITLRAYTYIDGKDNMMGLDGTNPDGQATNFTILIDQYIPPASWSQVGVTAIVGNSALTYAAVPCTISTASSPTTGVADNGVTGATPPSPGNMACTIWNPDPFHTEMIFYNSPLRALPCTLAGGPFGGLNPSDRLYGAEYIPCAVEGAVANAYVTNLATAVTVTNTPKNTARWIISMPVSQGCVTIETCLGSGITHSGWPLQTGFTGNSGWPYFGFTTTNISRTYVWVGNGFPPPYTERFQYLGDPRDCPYEDCKFGTVAVFGTVAGMGATIAANSYNWWFKDGAATSTNVGLNNDGFQGFGAAGDSVGWEGLQTGGTTQPSQGMASELDLPRYYETIRSGLLNTTAIWGVINGWTCYYYGMGGEFGADQDPFSNGVSLYSLPYQTTSAGATPTSAQEILGSGMGWGSEAPVTQMRVISNTQDTWYEKSWLGELCPDSQIQTYWTSGVGNLPVAVGTAGTSTFYRKLYKNVPVTEVGGAISSNNGFGRNLTSQANQYGSPSFMNGVGAGSEGGGSFVHYGPGTDDVGNILSLGQTCYTIFGYPLPSVVKIARPWSVSSNLTPCEFELPPYNTERTNLFIAAVNGISRLFYDVTDSSNQGPWHASGTIQISMGVSQFAYFVESGLDISANVGLTDLGETALICMLRSFLDGGNYPVGQGHIYQIPLIETYCDNPAAQYSDPTVINLLVDGAVTTGVPLTIAGWTSFPSGPTTNIWFRWPGYTSETGNFYTEEYPGYPNLANSTYSEPVSSVDFNIKWSPNAGENWYFIQDNSAAVTGVLDPSLAHRINVTSMPLTYVWNVANAGTFPQQSYWICAEGFRHGFPFDYSFHVLNISIIR